MKINVAELLKDCPIGMELDSPVLIGKKTFKGFRKWHKDCPIEVQVDSDVYFLTIYGQMFDVPSCGCVIFPKGKTTWEGFVPPCNFKDGDFLYCDANDCGENDDRFKYVFIFDKLEDGKYYYSHCHLGGGEFYDGKTFLVNNNYPVRFATEEEKQKLFQAIKDNGYTWNANMKCLEELVGPKFHKGDWITNGDYTWKIVEVKPLGYILQSQDGNIVDDTISHVDEQFHSFTIEDAKDGDVLTTDTVYFIFKSTDKLFCHMHCNYSVISDNFNTSDTAVVDSEYVHPATTEQRDILFQKIKETGYKWNKETKALEKLVEPKFKVGDRIRLLVYNNVTYTVIDMTGTHYTVKSDGKYVCEYSIPISTQDKYELAPKKFDVNTLKPFDKVLVRTERFTPIWTIAFYDGYQPEIGGGFRPFGVVNGEYFQQCIPYEGNEHLRGTTNDCDDFYKNW